MRRYKFRMCILVCTARSCVSVCVCVYIRVYAYVYMTVCSYVCSRVRVCVWGMCGFYLYYMYIVCTTRRWHDYLDWKKVAARSRGAGDPIAIVCLLKEGFFTLSRSLFLRFRVPARSKDRPGDPRLGRGAPLPFRSSFFPKLSQARSSPTLAHLVRTLSFSVEFFFYFSFDCKPLFLSNIPLKIFVCTVHRARV